MGPGPGQGAVPTAAGGGVLTASVWRRNVARRLHPEDELQRAVVQFLDLALPDDALYFHIPNGGQRHKKAAARLVGLGVLAGVPDLQVVWRGRGLFIELKAAQGVLSKAQRRVIPRLIYCGAEVMSCRSVAQVEAALRKVGVPLRASVA